MSAPGFDCCEISPDQLDLIGPLWKKLQACHVKLDPGFAAARARRSFAQRKKDFLAKAAHGGLRIDTALAEGSNLPVGYCVASLSAQGAGEIDSLFVEEAWRGRGIGTALMRRALDWLHRNDMTARVVKIGWGNEAALKFYARFGFAPYLLELRQLP